MAAPVSAVLASKCLKGKPATLARTGEACLLLVELEQGAVVVESVLKAFSDKVPKVVLAAVDIILQAVRWVHAAQPGGPQGVAAQRGGQRQGWLGGGGHACGVRGSERGGTLAPACLSPNRDTWIRAAPAPAAPAAFCPPRAEPCAAGRARSARSRRLQLLWREGAGPQAHHQVAAAAVRSHPGGGA